MDALPNLKGISNHGVGYDGIDANHAAGRGILVTHTPGVLNDEVANTAIMLWLATSRKLADPRGNDALFQLSLSIVLCGAIIAPKPCCSLGPVHTNLTITV